MISKQYRKACKPLPLLPFLLMTAVLLAQQPHCWVIRRCVVFMQIADHYRMSSGTSSPGQSR
jgi:hypothetical protein